MWRRRLIAIQAADDLLVELDVDQEKAIDVFSICEDLGLWLAFKPMKNLLGAFVPSGVGGVLVTTERSVHLQRSTVAHEIGHWALEKIPELALDDENSVGGQNVPAREQLAQLFAAHFLIPPPLVSALLDRVGVVKGRPLTPLQAYSFGREAGVSYEAGLRHLMQLEVVGETKMRELLRVHPIDIKAIVGHGHRPMDARADVWAIDERWDKAAISIHLHDEIVVSLPENRTTGYRWLLGDDATGLAQSRSTPKAPPAPFDYETAKGNDETDLSNQRAPKAKVILPSYLVSPFSSDAIMQVVHDEYSAGRIAQGDRPRPQKARHKLTSNQMDFLKGSETDTRTTSPSREDSAGDMLIGTVGRRLITLRADRPGSAKLRFEYRPLHDHMAKAENPFEIETIVSASRKDLSRAQLARPGLPK